MRWGLVIVVGGLVGASLYWMAHSTRDRSADVVAGTRRAEEPPTRTGVGSRPDDQPGQGTDTLEQDDAAPERHADAVRQFLSWLAEQRIEYATPLQRPLADSAIESSITAMSEAQVRQAQELRDRRTNSSITDERFVQLMAQNVEHAAHATAMQDALAARNYIAVQSGKYGWIAMNLPKHLGKKLRLTSIPGRAEDLVMILDLSPSSVLGAANRAYRDAVEK